MKWGRSASNTRTVGISQVWWVEQKRRHVQSHTHTHPVSHTICISKDLLTPFNRMLLQKLTLSRLVKKFPTFYGAQSFITAFTPARHLSLSWDSSIQSTPPHPASWKFILILTTHLRLGLPSGFFPSGFPTKTIITPLLYHIRATCPVHLILLDFITRKIFGEQYRSLSSSLCSFLHSSVTSSFWGPNILLSTL